jgi:Ni/Co efflux regulator RcnB
MKHRTLTTLVAALVMAVPALSMAQPHDRDDHGPDRGHDNRRDDRREGRHDDHDRHDVRGAGPNHDFHRGGRLPSHYRERQYVVDDWRGHHLHAPPRGYHWVQTGPDYVLVAIASGLIAQVILGQ